MFAKSLQEVGDMESDLAMFKAFIVEVAVLICGQKVVNACRGSNQTSC